MKGWHFIRSDRKLGYGDGRVVKPGETYTHKGPLALCQNGLHACKRAIDVLNYTPGPLACRVELGGHIVHDFDKSVATTRKVLWMVNAEELLRRFGRLCALDVIHLWDPPDVVLRWLKTGDESIRNAAWAAAWGAAAQAVAQDATWAAARAVAQDAAWAAAWAVARAAAQAAARDAARDATQDAARAVARDKQNRRLTTMLSRAPRVTL